MKRLIFAAAAVLVAAVLLSAKSPETPQGSSPYVLMEASTGAVIDSRDPDKRVNAGSMTKLMALLMVAEDIETGRYSPGDVLTASQSVYGTKGAVVWLEPGDKMTVDELLKSAVIGNANDAMIVLAEKSEGSLEKFVMRMNAEAFDFGMRDTAFYSPCGYYDEREYTTAHDLALVCRELSRYEFMLPYFKTWRDFVKEGETELVNENTLARTYERHIGFKACHSEDSGYCIAEGGRDENGTVFIAVILGAADEDEMFTNARMLLKKGFMEYKVTATMFPDEMLMPVKVRDGTESAVEIRLRSQNNIVIPKGVGELRTVVVIPDFLNAPLRKGQPIGTAAFYNGSTLMYETDIIVNEGVDQLTLGFTMKKMLLKLLK